MKEATELKSAISKYCRAAINAGFCEDDTCEWCAINQAYEIAESVEETFDEEEEEE